MSLIHEADFFLRGLPLFLRHERIFWGRCTFIVQMTEREYSHIAQQCREDLYRYAVRYTGDGDSAWDVVQDALVELWTHRADVERDKAKGFMIRVMYRELVDIHRRKVRFRERMPELVGEQW